MVIGKDNPANNVKEFVEWAKQHADKMNYPATSPAFILPSEQLKLKTGMPGVMIPYKSSNEMILSVMEGQTAFAIADGPPTVPQVKAGKVKALAVTGSTRSAELPDTPSMAEEGFPDVDIHLWSGIFAPAATPPDVVAKLEKALNEAIRDPGVSAKLKTMAADPGGGSPDEFRRLVDTDITKFTAIVKAANLHFEE
jgi:tripartite-type tricarboxylate transporter receptor subunit TctC